MVAFIINAKDTNMLVSFALGDANFSRHPNAIFLHWPCTFLSFLCRFHLHLVANAKFPVKYGFKYFIFYIL